MQKLSKSKDINPILLYMFVSSISICMQKMKEIYHARVTSSRAKRHVTSYYGPTGRARSTEYAKFRIQIGPLAAEIRPFS